MSVGAGSDLLNFMAVMFFIQSTIAANSSGQEPLSATVRGLGHADSPTLGGG